MTKKTINLSDALYDYLLDVSLREHPVAAKLRAATEQLEMARMLIAPDQGQFMGLLVRLIGARQTLDIGVFTGYSALSVALALPVDGRVVAMDTSEEWTAIAKPYWQEAGVAGNIDLKIAPALETLDGLIEAGEAGQYDFAFIDADKENYARYFERALELLRPGGVVAVDNVLWGGRVIDEMENDADTRAIRAFNKQLHADQRVHISMLPLADGLTLALKKS